MAHGIGEDTSMVVEPKHVLSDDARVIARVNRKRWWHVPPVESDAYQKRGKFLASSFGEAEFYGRPLDTPEKVTIARPLVGDEETIANVLAFPRRTRT